MINVIYTKNRPQLTLFLLSAIAFKRQALQKRLQPQLSTLAFTQV